MPRKTGRVATRRTRPAKPTAKPGSAAAADGSSSTTTVTKPAGILFGGREPTTREIRDRAYFIYLARGGVNGDALADWGRAERELHQELRGTAQSSRRF